MKYNNSGIHEVNGSRAVHEKNGRPHSLRTAILANFFFPLFLLDTFLHNFFTAFIVAILMPGAGRKKKNQIIGMFGIIAYD